MGEGERVRDDDLSEVEALPKSPRETLGKFDEDACEGWEVCEGLAGSGWWVEGNSAIPKSSSSNLRASLPCLAFVRFFISRNLQKVRTSLPNGICHKR